ncbi:MAG: hypothetical protein LLF86_02270 [Nitrospiraceae bacterium]|nr:hypothetical protein [Nitrospiraceae bacterium]
MENSGFTITRDKDTLVLKTSWFSTLQQSVLHSGAFNKEMASSISAGIVMLALLFALRSAVSFSFEALVFGVILFGALFLVFRVFVFRKPVLEARFSKPNNLVIVSKTRHLIRTRRRFRLSDVEAAVLKEIIHSYSNPDGIRMVEKIALHHHTALPGFSRTVKLFAASVRRSNNEEVLLFSSEDKENTDKVIEEINNFLEVDDAKTD